MDWTKSYSSEWRVFKVNTDTWADDESVDGIISADVLKTGDGANIESGSLEVTGEFSSGYYRISMTAEQSGDVERVDVATLLFVENGGTYDYGVNTVKIDGFSVLHPAETTSVLTGEYAPAGVDGAQYAGALLSNTINAPVVVEGSFILNDHIVHELGSTVLSAAWAVLDAGPDGGYIIQIDGQGVVHIRPRPSDPALVIDNSASGLLLNGIEYSADESEIPNRYIIIDDVNITVAENNDPESVVSSVSRGYYVDMIDTSPTPIDGETYSEYADRMLRKESILKEDRSYKREFAPEVYPYSLIRSTIEGLEGDYRVQSQSLSCENGITVSEKVSKEIALYE